MDVRLITLYKLHVPKTESFSRLVNVTEEDSHNHKSYFTMGHYDMFDMFKIDYSASNNQKQTDTLSCIYDKVKQYSDKRIFCSAFSSNKLLVFSNEDDEKIRSFWDTDYNINDEPNQHLMFVAMLHIADTETDTVTLTHVTERIRNIYSNKNYTLYYTFDYSDIIIFSKGLSVSEYQCLINRLNFDTNNDETKHKLVYDSFSLYGICRSYLLHHLDVLNNALKRSEDEFSEKISELSTLDSENTFVAKVNIGIQNYNTLMKYRNYLEKYPDNNSIEINQLGRHDYSIINKEATLGWLIYVEFLIDYYTTINENLKITDDNVLLTFEAFIGSKFKEYEDINQAENKHTPVKTEYLLQLCERLKTMLCDNYLNAVDFYTPIEEVKNSIQSINKNSFAEDFVLCMYESFVRFVEYTEKYFKNYLREKPVPTKSGVKIKQFFNDDKLSKMFSSYFSGLTSLINSGMHTDRSFIQATAFNAVFFDVPPKLMAFYTAFIYKLEKIMRDAEESNYSFLFTPDFSTTVKVKWISPQNMPPDDRILSIAINERSFYCPSSLLMVMAHEIAHYAGDSMRNRETRMQYFCLSCIVDILITTDPDVRFGNNFISMVEKIYSVIGNVIFPDSTKKCEAVFSSHYDDLVAVILRVMHDNNEIHTCIDKFVKNETKYKKQTVIEAHMRMTEILDNLSDVNFAVSLERDNIFKHARNIKSAMIEAYADLQMLLLLGKSCSEYFNEIFFKNCAELKDIQRLRHKSRFIPIVRIMIDLGLWSFDDINAFSQQLGDKVSEFSTFVLEAVRDLEYFTNTFEKMNFSGEIKKLQGSSSIFNRKYEPKFDEVNNINEAMVQDEFDIFCVYKYLLYAGKSMLERYSMIESKIDNLRKTYQSICCIKNIEDVYQMMQKENIAYKNSLNNLGTLEDNLSKT